MPEYENVMLTFSELQDAWMETLEQAYNNGDTDQYRFQVMRLINALRMEIRWLREAVGVHERYEKLYPYRRQVQESIDG